MKQIILERNVDYAIWENLLYALLFFSALFIGTTFFSTGKLALFCSIFSGIIVMVCIICLSIKKGLVVNRNLYRAYFVFGQLIFKHKVEATLNTKFTLLANEHRQKYIRGNREPNWEYNVSSFDLHFFDSDGAIQDKIISCMKLENCGRAQKFIQENTLFVFVSLY